MNGLSILIKRLMQCHVHYLIHGPRHKKNLILLYASNKGADQPVHPRSLVSAFVTHFLESGIA